LKEQEIYIYKTILINKIIIPQKTKEKNKGINNYTTTIATTYISLRFAAATAVFIIFIAFFHINNLSNKIYYIKDSAESFRRNTT